MGQNSSPLVSVGLLINSNEPQDQTRCELATTGGLAPSRPIFIFYVRLIRVEILCRSAPFWEVPKDAEFRISVMLPDASDHGPRELDGTIMCTQKSPVIEGKLYKISDLCRGSSEENPSSTSCSLLKRSKIWKESMANLLLFLFFHVRGFPTGERKVEEVFFQGDFG